MFFFLAQTEQGDIFKITLETDEEMVRAVATDWALGDIKKVGLVAKCVSLVSFKYLFFFFFFSIKDS